MYISKLQGINEQNSTFKAKKISNKKIEKSIDKLPQIGTAALGALGATIVASANTGNINPQELQKDLDNNMSWSQIAKKYGKSTASIRQFAAKHGLTTHDGKILQSVTKEDLLRWKEEGLSQKEVAQKLGLNHAGSLTPLLKIFGIEPLTVAKVSRITHEDWVEYKKQGLLDDEIAEILNVAPIYILKQRKQLGYKLEDAKDLREYPVEDIKKAIATKSLKEVENDFGFNHAELLRIIKKYDIEIPPQNEKERFEQKKKQILDKINDFPDNSELKYDIMDVKSLRIIPENIELIDNIINRKNISENDYRYSYALRKLKNSNNENPYEDVTKMLKAIPVDNELGLDEDEVAGLFINVARDNLSVDDLIDVYNTIISHDELKEHIQRHPKFHRSGDYIFSALVNEKAAGTKENLEKILNDENLSKHIDLLLFSNTNRKDYSKILDLFARQPELLENEKVRELIKDGFYPFMTSTNYLTHIKIKPTDSTINPDYTYNILKISNENDRNKLLQIYSKENLDRLYEPQLALLSVVPRLEKLFQNSTFINRLDDLVNHMSPQNHTSIYRILEQVNNMDAILNNDDKMNELMSTLMNIRSNPERSLKVNRLLNEN